MGWRDQPPLFRHVVVAIYNKGHAGGGADGVVRAMKMARDVLAKQGLLYHRGSNQVLEGIVLTGKGVVRNAKHIREGLAGDRKDQQYQKLFKLIEPRLYELDGPGGKKPPKPVNKPGEKEAGINVDAPASGSKGALYPPPK